MATEFQRMINCRNFHAPQVVFFYATSNQIVIAFLDTLNLLRNPKKTTNEITVSVIQIPKLLHPSCVHMDSVIWAWSFDFLI